MGLFLFMGMSPPEQKDAQGSGLTFQRSNLPQDITDKTQAGFRSTLSNALGQTGGLANMQRVGSFNPGQLYSSNLDPLVQAQLSRAADESAQGMAAQNAQLSDRLGPGNSTLIGALQAQNANNAVLSQGPMRLAALEQQRQFDLASRQAQESAFGINANAIQANNQAQMQSAAMSQDLLKALGQGIISTSPQVQGQFTLADMREIAKSPELFEKFAQNVPGGIMGESLQGQLTADPYRGVIKTAAVPTTPAAYRYVAGNGWTNDGITFTNAKPGAATTRYGVR